MALGNVPFFLEAAELEQFDVVSYGFEDAEALYLRGQWTVHRNVRKPRLAMRRATRDARRTRAPRAAHARGAAASASPPLPSPADGLRAAPRGRAPAPRRTRRRSTRCGASANTWA